MLRTERGIVLDPVAPPPVQQTIPSPELAPSGTIPPTPEVELREQNQRLTSTVEELTDLLEAQTELIAEEEDEEDGETPSEPTNSSRTRLHEVTRAAPEDRAESIAEIRPVGEEPTPPASPITTDTPPPEAPQPQPQKRGNPLRSLWFGR